MSLRCRKNKINSQNTQVPIFTWVHSRVGEKKKVFSWYYGNFSWDCAAMRSFFFRGCKNLSQIFLHNVAFFLFHRVISGVFFASSDHFDFCGLSTGSWWKTRTSTWVAKIQNLASYIFWCLSYAFLVQISKENFIEPTLHNVGF